MKKLLYFITCITLFSCSKDSNTPSGTNASGSIQYKVNGNLIVIDNVDILSGQYAIFYKLLKGSTLVETVYELNAQKGANNVLAFALVSDSLKQISYHYDSIDVFTNPTAFNFALGYNGQLGAIFYNGDMLDVNISSYKNSRITGTFSAKLSPGSDYNQRGTVLITEGVINNVQVVY
jgi:hypothetical protein